MSRTNFKDLLDAGVHFGHLKRKWNPKMAPYIFMENNGIHIIDLHKTVVKVDEAAAAVKQIAKSGRKILFVATKKQGIEIVNGHYSCNLVHCNSIIFSDMFNEFSCSFSLNTTRGYCFFCLLNRTFNYNNQKNHDKLWRIHLS